MRKRYIGAAVDDLVQSRHKILFLSGPRQVGKTSFAKELLTARGNGSYYNWDSLEFKRIWARNPGAITSSLNRSPTPIVILDEIHKSKKWKGILKGIFDSTPLSC